MKVCAPLVDRANLGRLLPVLDAIHKHPDLELSVIAGGTMPLKRFGAAVEVVRNSGFPVAAELFHEVEGNTPATMARSTGLGVIEFAGAFERLTPDVVLCIGDRYEMLAAATAAYQMTIPICHVQGGERSGCIDDKTRNMLTACATWHVPATEKAALGIRSATCGEAKILCVGCPSSDLAKHVRLTEPLGILAAFHPDTNHSETAADEMRELLTALATVRHPTLLLWPNIDSGSDAIAKAIRTFKQQPGTGWLKTEKNLPPEAYLQKLANVRCAVGNSSSMCRDGTFFGVPTVLVGSRQDGRETCPNVLRVEPQANAIEGAIRAQLENGRYPASKLYGDGNVSSRIVEALLKLDL